MTSPNYPPPAGDPAPSGASPRISTPRLLRLLRAAIVLTSLAAGLVAAWVLTGAAAGLHDISAGTQQLQRLQLIKGDVLRADGLATNGLLQGAIEPTAQRETYKNQLTEAARLTVDASQAQSRDQGDLASVNAALVNYAATMELARTSVRADAKAGLKYVDEAGSALRTQAIPALNRLLAANEDRVNAARSTDRLWAVAIASVPAVVVLLAGVLVARRARRLLNLGLILALLAAVVMWRIVDDELTGSAAAVDAARSGVLRTATSASHAYATVSDAKSYEGRALLQPAKATALETETEWRALMAQARGDAAAVADGRARLSEQLQAYEAAHTGVLSLVAEKKITEAARQAVSTAPAGVNATYAAFADNARRVASAAGADTARDMSGKADGLYRGALFAALLGLAAAVAGALGLAGRLKEYR